MFESALLPCYNRHQVHFSYGMGAYLYNEAADAYLDFLSGIAVTGFGHAHPDIMRGLTDQAGRYWHISNLFAANDQEILAKRLTEHAGLDYAFFCNSGTEANEAAIKFARRSGEGRSRIIAAQGGFHGRTLGSLSATGQPKLWKDFGPMVEGFDFVPYGDANAIESLIESETIAVMLEPIQGESGVIIPPEGYLKDVRRICDENGLILIFDEVQCGMGRTGKFFAHHWDNIKPDILTLAKGIANGIPLGACICTREIGEKILPGDHGSTFGGNPLAVAAAIRVTKLLTDDRLEHIQKIGNYLISKLKSLEWPAISDVRGKGLMIGIELADGLSAKTVAKELLKERVIVGTSGESVLRILPPFIIKISDVDLFLKKFTSVMEQSLTRETLV